MQIVIDIPDEEVPNKQDIMDIDLHFIGGKVCECTYPYIVLPKRHGRLIDADALEKLCYEHEIGNSAFDGEPLIAQGQYDDGDNIWKSLFDFAPTIIEADKAESEDKE